MALQPPPQLLRRQRRVMEHLDCRRGRRGMVDRRRASAHDDPAAEGLRSDRARAQHRRAPPRLHRVCGPHRRLRPHAAAAGRPLAGQPPCRLPFRTRQEPEVARPYAQEGQDRRDLRTLRAEETIELAGHEKGRKMPELARHQTATPAGAAD